MVEILSDYQPHLRPAFVSREPPLCAGCGRCCHLVVELRPGDRVRADWITRHNGVPCMAQHGDGACIALDQATRLCTIYAKRPQTCRDFARGSALCHVTLARFEAKAKPAV